MRNFGSAGFGPPWSLLSALDARGCAASHRALTAGTGQNLTGPRKTRLRRWSRPVRRVGRNWHISLNSAPPLVTSGLWWAAPSTAPPMVAFGVGRARVSYAERCATDGRIRFAVGRVHVSRAGRCATGGSRRVRRGPAARHHFGPADEPTAAARSPLVGHGELGTTGRCGGDNGRHGSRPFDHTHLRERVWVSTGQGCGPRRLRR